MQNHPVFTINEVTKSTNFIKWELCDHFLSSYILLAVYLLSYYELDVKRNQWVAKSGRLAAAAIFVMRFCVRYTCKKLLHANVTFILSQCNGQINWVACLQLKQSSTFSFKIVASYATSIQCTFATCNACEGKTLSHSFSTS